MTEDIAWWNRLEKAIVWWNRLEKATALARVMDGLVTADDVEADILPDHTWELAARLAGTTAFPPSPETRRIVAHLLRVRQDARRPRLQVSAVETANGPQEEV